MAFIGGLESIWRNGVAEEGIAEHSYGNVVSTCLDAIACVWKKSFLVGPSYRIPFEVRVGCANCVEQRSFKGGTHVRGDFHAFATSPFHTKQGTTSS